MAADTEEPRAPALSLAPPAPPDLVEEAEAAAWAEVRAAWDDEATHRAYLASFPDLDGLARAGRRYRAVLAVDPRNAIAARWRDEVVKRAMVQGLAQMPRTKPPRKLPRWVLVTVVGGGAAAAMAWAAAALFRLFGQTQGALP
jgi:hypothetical protein